MNPKGGLYALRYLFNSIIVISGSDRPNKREKEMSSERETLKGGYARHLESIPQSTPAINSIGSTDEW